MLSGGKDIQALLCQVTHTQRHIMASSRERKRLAAVMAYVKRGTFKGAARDVGTEPKFVRRWVQHFNATGGVEKKGAGGRPRALDDAATGRALELLIAKGSGGADSVARQLYSEGFTTRKLNRRTIAKRAKERAKLRGTDQGAHRQASQGVD